MKIMFRLDYGLYYIGDGNGIVYFDDYREAEKVLTNIKGVGK